jgi:murein DD-endopeptidase MepM/ murein hydrolase activator NlpD
LTARKARLLAGMISFLTVAITGASVLTRAPSLQADTARQFKEAKARLAAVQKDLNRLASLYSLAQSRYAMTQTEMVLIQGQIAGATARMEQIQAAIDARAWAAYESGGADTLQVLLTSATFDQFADRVEFLGTLAQSDGDLLTGATTTREQLRRYRADLSTLATSQATEVADLARQKSAIAAKFSEARSVVRSLRKKLRRQLAVTGTVVLGRGALKACPVGRPRAFVDDFGDPRPGGRYHQGIDMLAPYGTPVFAAQSGRLETNYNSLGGISALLYADNGDYTYYAHLSSYAGVGSGSHVAAGTMIGHVGNTGDASGGPFHLHFEYHPGGGGAIDPYRLLLGVCG